MIVAPSRSCPGGVVTGLDWCQVIADRGSTRPKAEVVRNVDAET